MGPKRVSLGEIVNRRKNVAFMRGNETCVCTNVLVRLSTLDRSISVEIGFTTLGVGRSPFRERVSESTKCGRRITLRLSMRKVKQASRVQIQLRSLSQECPWEMSASNHLSPTSAAVGLIAV